MYILRIVPCTNKVSWVLHFSCLKIKNNFRTFWTEVENL